MEEQRSPVIAMVPRAHAAGHDTTRFLLRRSKRPATLVQRACKRNGRQHAEIGQQTSARPQADLGLFDKFCRRAEGEVPHAYTSPLTVANQVDIVDYSARYVD